MCDGAESCGPTLRLPTDWNIRSSPSISLLTAAAPNGELIAPLLLAPGIGEAILPVDELLAIPARRCGILMAISLRAASVDASDTEGCLPDVLRPEAPGPLLATLDESTAALSIHEKPVPAWPACVTFRSVLRDAVTNW